MNKAKFVSTPIGVHFKLTSVKESDYEEEYEYMKGIPYSNAVGSIMYGMICTRPEVAYGIGLVSRFMSKPGRVHWNAVKWLLRYFKGTVKLKLKYKVDGNKSCKVFGYCDSDFKGDLNKRRSIFGYVFTIGGNTISWKSSLQRVVALSSTEAEYIALTEATKEALWWKGMLDEIGCEQGCVDIFCDSRSAIHLTKHVP